MMHDFSPGEYGLLALLSIMGTAVAAKEASLGAGWPAVALVIYGAIVTLYCLWRWRRLPQ